MFRQAHSCRNNSLESIECPEKNQFSKFYQSNTAMAYRNALYCILRKEKDKNQNSNVCTEGVLQVLSSTLIISCTAVHIKYFKK